MYKSATPMKPNKDFKAWPIKKYNTISASIFQISSPLGEIEGAGGLGILYLNAFNPVTSIPVISK